MVKGAAGNGTENTGETGPAFAWPGVIGTRDRKVPSMSRRSVADVLYAAKAAGIGWDDVANRPDDEVYALLFPGRGERGSV